MDMSIRLQVLLPEREMAEIQRLARLEHLAVGEWVRRALRDARSRQPTNDPQIKLNSIRKATEHSFPSADIERMLHEIEEGYQR